MRLLVSFDLPQVTPKDRKEYRSFIKTIKSLGFYMLQESLYVKLNIDDQSAEATGNAIRRELPPKGLILLIKITEKQFAAMDCLLGELKTDVVNNDARLIEL